MTQQKNILNLLNKTKFVQWSTSDTPVVVSHKLTLSEDHLKVEMNSNQKLIGKLLYIRLILSPDLSYSVNVLSQFTHSP